MKTFFQLTFWISLKLNIIQLYALPSNYIGCFFGPFVFQRGMTVCQAAAENSSVAHATSDPLEYGTTHFHDSFKLFIRLYLPMFLNN
jgi:hypothetical protein